MRGSKIFAVLSILPLVTQAANIVLSNDDSWVEINIRKLFQVLTEAGENVVLSAPAENKSGTGMFTVLDSNVSISRNYLVLIPFNSHIAIIILIDLMLLCMRSSGLDLMANAFRQAPQTHRQRS